MGFKRLFSKTYQRFSKWTFEGPELPEKSIVIGAYHTSNWDGWLMLMAMWDRGVPFKFLVKDSLTKGVVAPVIRAVGGIGVNRKHPNGMVAGIVERLAQVDRFSLVIAPEGTRKKKDYWKSGFYHIARGADLPVTLGFIDSKRMVYGWGESITLTGDVRADMDKIRAFYEPTAGLRPDQGTYPRLRIEEESPQG
ncbi:1-acyl-sn-glycerol-3-phosphate acyltransferase [Trueperella pecoris]|uniref:1-acyl-sn-glycerol-3-phosphate acyltransferase n=1 Tax=Trueperella pecoris TaxID=2733571 RepID=A0A7M1QUY4_9ACTO|nr:1-acyl-sn-glycerol-3-phosphate acyltransferase [Trueperella pecoris]QOQ39740.1 acyltransferase [Trueperella pecoris]QOR45633.1 1-acyl-sn-glycerol-3-phosphate acyltransferase [Trueperella pecoris]